jgi:hypothetical protein
VTATTTMIWVPRMEKTRVNLILDIVRSSL